MFNIWKNIKNCNISKHTINNISVDRINIFALIKKLNEDISFYLYTLHKKEEKHFFYYFAQNSKNL